MGQTSTSAFPAFVHGSVRANNSTPRRNSASSRTSSSPPEQRTVPPELPSAPQAPNQNLFRDIGHWAETRKVGVSKCDAYIVETLNRAGIASHVFERGTHNPHAFSAACREAAVMQVLTRAGKNKFEMKGWDVFGSPRTLAYDPSSSGPFGSVVRPDGRKVSSRSMKIDWFSGPDTVVQGDAARGNFVRSGNDTGPFDVVILVDVYQSGGDSQQPFTPLFASELISKSRDGVIYWIGRFFEGLAGADDPIILDDGSSVVEQVFVKDVAGRVVSSSDRDSGCYAPHPWPEWLSQRSFAGLDISPVNRVGPYRIVRIALTPPSAIQIMPIPAVLGMCTEMELDTTYRLFWTIPVYSKKVVKVVVQPFLTVSSKMIRKLPNGQLLDMAQVLVEQEFNRDPRLTEIRFRFPSQYHELVSGTVLASVYFGRHEHSTQLALLRQAHVTSEQSLSSARRADNAFNAPWHRLVLGGLGIGAAAAFAAARYQLRPGSWILPAFPLVSAALEECLAWFWEPLALTGAVFEAWTSWDSQRPGWRFAMHLACSALRVFGGTYGRVAALAFHVGWNAIAAPSKSRVSEFLDCYRRGEILQDVGSRVECIPEHLTLPSYTAKMIDGPKAFRGKIEVYIDNCPVSVSEAFGLLENQVGRNVVFPILVTHRLLFAPANVETNLLAAALHRLHNDPFKDCLFTEEQRHANWAKLADIFIERLLPDQRCAVYSVGDNIRAMGKKGHRLRDAYDADMVGKVLFSRKTVNLKWNETISASKEVNGLVTMKPRAIQNLPPLVHAQMGGYARSFSDELHRLFDGGVHDICGVPVRIFFASGYDQARLSEIGRAAQAGHTVFAMSGDDSFVAWGGIKPCFASEADQSQFDHTQDRGPMRCFMRPVLRRLGFPESFIDQAFNACSAGYTLRKGRLFAKGEAGVQMPTGITTTTSFNSLDTLGMFVWFLFNRHRLAGLTEAGAELGFIVKEFDRESVHHCTFLKGWFQDGPDGLQWVPLPSACLKIGKLLTDPVDITRVVRKGKKVRFSRAEAIAQCATALAQSYGTVDPTYPVLGEFLRTMSRLGKQPKRVLGELQESWKPVMSGIKVDRQCVLDAMLCRYGIDKEEVEEVEALLRKVSSLPSYVEHVVFDKLCQVDY